MKLEESALCPLALEHRSCFALEMSESGTIKKFFEDKGFGFVTPDDGDDVFVHVKDNPDLEGAQSGDVVYFDKDWDDRKGKYKGTNLSLKSGGGGGKGGGKGKGKSSRYDPW